MDGKKQESPGLGVPVCVSANELKRYTRNKSPNMFVCIQLEAIAGCFRLFVGIPEYDCPPFSFRLFLCILSLSLSLSFSQSVSLFLGICRSFCRLSRSTSLCLSLSPSLPVFPRIIHFPELSRRISLRLTLPTVSNPSHGSFCHVFIEGATVVSKMITDRCFSEDNEFQLQIQNCAARGVNFHYRDRSVEISAEISYYRCRFSLEFHLIFIMDTDFGLETN